jgi:hypothetical protein
VIRRAKAHCDKPMRTEIDELDRLLVTHRRAQRLLDCGSSFYWGLVKKGRITVVGRGRASRADFRSLRAYVAAEAQARQEG